MRVEQGTLGAKRIDDRDLGCATDATLSGGRLEPDRHHPPLRLCPCTIARAQMFVADVHRRLPRIQGGRFAVAVHRGDGVLVGVAIVGTPARALMQAPDESILAVLRVAVLEGHPNACSMLYGACSRAARAIGADSLVSYTHVDEHGASLRASGWVGGGLTRGGEQSRPSRARRAVADPRPKRRWWAPWSSRARKAGVA